MLCSASNSFAPSRQPRHHRTRASKALCRKGPTLTLLFHHVWVTTGEEAHMRHANAMSVLSA